MFLELGWNTVLHSAEGLGDGVGLFCGQVVHPSSYNRLENPELTFCIADFGRGIPETLGGIYDRHRDEDRKYHVIENKTRATGIVRFALDNDTTSRPKNVSDMDAEGCRGLAYVVSALERYGLLKLRSDAGMVEVKDKRGGVKAHLSDEYKDHPIPGTQVIGVLRAIAKITPVAVPRSQIKKQAPGDILRACDLSGDLGALSTSGQVSQYLKTFPASSNRTMVIDMGCSSTTARTIEYLSKKLTERYSQNVIVLWNVRIEWSLLESLGRWLLEKRRRGTEACIVAVKSWQDVLVLGVDPPRRQYVVRHLKEVSPWLHLLEETSGADYENVAVRGAINPSDFLEIARRVNTKMIEDGFKGRNEVNGYYVGRIHLLSGEVVRRYFSFNRNIAGQQGNLDRWAETVLCCLRLVEEANPDNKGKCILLGFTGIIRELLAKILVSIPNATRAYTVLSYDVPLIEEIRGIIDKGDHVILITDVISTGSSACAIAGLVRKAGGNVSGIIAVVDARRDGTFQSNSIEAAGERIALYSGALADNRDTSLGSEGSLFNEEFWVDPVSLVPATKRPRMWELPGTLLERLEYSVGVICKTNSAYCGHGVDGTRHIPTYIDLRRLLRRDTLGIRQRIEKRLPSMFKEYGWSNFSPTHIIYPKGISRIEGLQQESDIIVYDTAVQGYVSLLKAIWPSANEQDVLRVFDPGGNSRCAHIALDNVCSTTPLGDVVVADDGVWSARTIASLLDSVVQAGAKRVLVIPLLARMRTAELMYWESVCSVKGAEEGSTVSVCFYFPLVYPVPAYSAQECPYELTIRRLRQHALSSTRLNRLREEIVSDLEACTPAELPTRSPETTIAWVKLRCYLELASESEVALEKAIDVIKDAHDSQSLTGILELLLREWPITGRARIRQAITPSLRNLVKKLAFSPDSDPQLRILATRVLRSLFADTFAATVDSLIMYALADLVLLEHILLHIATFDARRRVQPKCIRFLEGISEAQPDDVKDLPEEKMNKYLELAAVSRRLWVDARLGLPQHRDGTAESAIDCAKSLYKLVSEDGIVFHELEPKLLQFDTGRDNLDQCSSDVWSHHYAEWKNVLEPLLLSQFLPQIAQLRDVLMRAATPQYDYVSQETEYLVERSGVEKHLAQDISTLTVFLVWLSEGRKPGRAVSIVGTCAKNIRNAICGNRRSFQKACNAPLGQDLRSFEGLSTLGRILLELRKWSVKQLLVHLHDRIISCLESSGKKPSVKMVRSTPIKEDEFLFLPSDLIDRVTGQITSNLQKYAFPLDWPSSTTADVKIISSMVDDDGETVLSITVCDKGRKCTGELTQGHAGRRLNATMHIFGASFPPPQPSEIGDWTAEQYTVMRTW